MTKTKLRAADAAGRSTLTASRAGYGFREPAARSPVPERLFVNDDCEATRYLPARPGKNSVTAVCTLPRGHPGPHVDGALDVSWLRRRRYRR